METLKAIMERRSTRSYRDGIIDDATVKELLKAAMYAPSANNRQPWHFIIVEDEKLLSVVPEIHQYAQMADKASMGIIVCGDLELEPEPGYLAVNCAAATQNMLLAAHDRGLGSVWIGIYPRQQRMDDFKKHFGLPAHILPISYVVLGYAASSKKAPERFLPGRIHKNGW